MSLSNDHFSQTMLFYFLHWTVLYRHRWNNKLSLLHMPWKKRFAKMPSLSYTFNKCLINPPVSFRSTSACWFSHLPASCCQVICSTTAETCWGQRRSETGNLPVRRCRPSSTLKRTATNLTATASVRPRLKQRPSRRPRGTVRFVFSTCLNNEHQQSTLPDRFCCDGTRFFWFPFVNACAHIAHHKLNHGAVLLHKMLSSLLFFFLVRERAVPSSCIAVYLFWFTSKEPN